MLGHISLTSLWFHTARLLPAGCGSSKERWQELRQCIDVAEDTADEHRVFYPYIPINRWCSTAILDALIDLLLYYCSWPTSEPRQAQEGKSICGRLRCCVSPCCDHYGVMCRSDVIRWKPQLSKPRAGMLCSPPTASVSYDPIAVDHHFRFPLPACLLGGLSLASSINSFCGIRFPRTGEVVEYVHIGRRRNCTSMWSKRTRWFAWVNVIRLLVAHSFS